MAITVANLVAQVGADLTQFKLGMNEVDARLALTDKKAIASSNAVRSLQVQSQRAAEASRRYADEAARVPLASLTQQFNKSYAELGKAQREMTAAATKFRKAVAAGAEDEMKAAKKAAEEAQKAFDKASDSAEALGRKMDAAEQKRNALLRRSGEAKEASLRLMQRSTDVSGVADASYNLDVARAAQAAQDAHEHRVRSVNALSMAATRAGVAILVALGGATKVGADLNKTLTQTAHNTSLTGAELERMKSIVKDLALESGADLTALAHSFQTIENYGFGVAESQKILSRAMQASVATGSDLNATSELLAGTMKNFRIPAEQSGRAINFLYGVSRLAKGELQDLVRSMGPAFATAGNKGVSLLETGAAFVLFTRHQIDASKAVTQFINVMQRIADPTVKVQRALANVDKQIQGIGVSLTRDFSQVGLRQKGITGVFEDIIKASNKMGVKPEDLAAKLLPNLRGTLGGTTIAKYMQEYVDVSRQLRSDYSQTDAVQKAYNETLKESGVQLDRLKNALLIFSGEVARSMTPVVEGITRKAIGLGNSWRSLSQDTRDNIVATAMWAGGGLIALGMVGKFTVGVANLRVALVELNIITKATTFASVTAGAGTALSALAALTVGVGVLYLAYRQLNAEMNATPAQMAKARAGQINEEYRRGVRNDNPGWDETPANIQQLARAGAAKRALDARKSYVASLSSTLKAINAELANGVVEASRQKKLIADRDALLRDASKNGLAVPVGVGGVMPVNPFENATIRGVPGADPLAGVYDKEQKQKAVRHKRTEYDKELAEANRYIEGLKESMSKLSYEGRLGELMWMAQSNVVMKAGGHYFETAKRLISLIEATERQNKAEAEGISLAEKWVGESNKREGVDKYQAARMEVVENLLHGQTEAVAMLTLEAIDNAQATERQSKAHEQLADVLQMVSAPLEKEQAVFNRVMKKVVESDELLRRVGPMGAAFLAMQAQANANAAKAAKDYEEALRPLNNEIEKYNALAAGRKDMTNEERAKFDIKNGKFPGIKKADEESLVTAAKAADVRERMTKWGDSIKAWGEGLVQTFDGVQKQADKLKEWTERFNYVWKDLADGTYNVFYNMFSTLRERGFKGIFNSIVRDFQQMLFDMAARWMASQLVQLIVGAVGGAAGQRKLGLQTAPARGANGMRGEALMGLASPLIAGGIAGLFGGMMAQHAAATAGAGIAGGLGSAFGGFLAEGGVAYAGMSYVVGDGGGPELFTPGVTGTVTPVKGGDVHNHTWNIVTPDASSFASAGSRSAIESRMAESIARSKRRNG